MGDRRKKEVFDPRQLNELVEIAQQLKKGAKELTVGTLLDTPTTVLNTSIDSGLYIRQEYWDLHDIIENKLKDRSIRRILVAGSPGIGKSVFGVFLLLLSMMEQKDIAYRPLGDPLIYFTWNSTMGYEYSDTPHVGRTYDGFFDGNEADGALRLSAFNRAFVFASPRTENYNDFVKTACFKVYMDPWTKEECQGLADAMELEDQDEWLRRFTLVGGKPRLLFSSSQTLDDLAEQVNQDIPHSVDELKDQIRLFEQKYSTIG